MCCICQSAAHNAGEQYPITVLFKAALASKTRGATSAPKNIGLFQSFLCTAYWVCTPPPPQPRQGSSTPGQQAAEALPRFSPPAGDGTGGETTVWRPDATGAIDIVASKVTVCHWRSHAFFPWLACSWCLHGSRELSQSVGTGKVPRVLHGCCLITQHRTTQNYLGGAAVGSIRTDALSYLAGDPRAQQECKGNAAGHQCKAICAGAAAPPFLPPLPCSPAAGEDAARPPKPSAPHLVQPQWLPAARHLLSVRSRCMLAHWLPWLGSDPILRLCTQKHCAARVCAHGKAVKRDAACGASAPTSQSASCTT